jgi:hypothetical protein
MNTNEITGPELLAWMRPHLAKVDDGYFCDTEPDSVIEAGRAAITGYVSKATRAPADLSGLTRYDAAMQGGDHPSVSMEEFDDGNFVKFSDVQALLTPTSAAAVGEPVKAQEVELLTDQLVGARYALRAIADGIDDPAKCAAAAIKVLDSLATASEAEDEKQDLDSLFYPPKALLKREDWDPLTRKPKAPVSAAEQPKNTAHNANAVGAKMPCGAVVTNVYEAYEAGQRAHLARQDQAGAVTMAAIGKLIATQDNRYTDQPMFIVQQRRRIIGFDTDYCDNIVWCCSEDEYSEASEEEAAKFEAEYQETGRAKNGWMRTGYVDQWEFVTACFTEQGCKDYLARDGHNLKEPRIYAEGSYRNEEFRSIRKWLMSLAAPTQATVPQRVEVPEGWKLVPVEPTIAMIQAGENARKSDARPWAASAIYAAMLAAAPAAQQGEQGSALYAWLVKASKCGLPAVESAARCLKDYYEGADTTPAASSERGVVQAWDAVALTVDEAEKNGLNYVTTDLLRKLLEKTRPAASSESVDTSEGLRAAFEAWASNAEPGYHLAWNVSNRTAQRYLSDRTQHTFEGFAARVAGVRKDAERLDFLEERAARNDESMPSIRAFGKTFVAETLRDAIDTAMAQSSSKEGE